MRGSIEGQFLFAAEGERGFFSIYKDSFATSTTGISSKSVCFCCIYSVYEQLHTTIKMFLFRGSKRFFCSEGLKKIREGQRG